MSDQRAAIILAAGKGKRMKSDLPKVLHRIHGRPIISILVDTLFPLKFAKIVVVVGYKGEMVMDVLSSYSVSFVWQKEQLGTGHAVQMAREMLGDFVGTTLVALGDVPFLSAATIQRLFQVHREMAAQATCLSAIVDDPSGYGRIIRDGDSNILKAIIEQKDATAPQRKIREINTGLFCFNNQELFKVIDRLDNDNAAGEYYLTDAVKIMNDNGLRVAVVPVTNPDEGLGVNSLVQLETLTKKYADSLK